MELLHFESVNHESCNFACNYLNFHVKTWTTDEETYLLVNAVKASNWEKIYKKSEETSK